MRSTPGGKATVKDGKYVSVLITVTELGDPPGPVLRHIPIDILCEDLELRASITNERRILLDFPGLTPEGKAAYFCELLNSLCVELEMVVEAGDVGSLKGSSCIVSAPLQWVSQLLETEIDV